MSVKTMCGFILLFAILRITAGQTSVDKHMICKEVTSIVGQQEQPATSAVQGRPGKIGPIGPPGVAGEPGTIDYAQMREIIRQEVQENFSRMDERFDCIIEQINKMNESLSQTQSEVDEELACLSEVGGIAYNGSCLWAEERPVTMTPLTALQTCNRRILSKLPEIYGQKEYLKIMGYLRSKINGTRNIETFTGMRRDSTTGKALLSDGSVAPYTKTRSTPSQWSEATGSMTYVYLKARPDPNDIDQGMGAVDKKYDFASNENIIFCQKL